MEKTPSKVGIEYNPLLPIDKENINVSSSCFGKAWDLADKNCHACADRDVCGILFKEKQDSEVKKLESEKMDGYNFLDQADLSLFTEDFVRSLPDGTSLEDFIHLAKLKTKCADDLAIVNLIKRFKEENPWLKIKNRIVCIVE